MKVIVHERVVRRHPELAESEVIHAWKHAFAVQQRTGLSQNILVAVGTDRKGRLLEMLASELANESYLVFHAMFLSEKVARELNL